MPKHKVVITATITTSLILDTDTFEKDGVPYELDEITAESDSDMIHDTVHSSLDDNLLSDIMANEGYTVDRAEITVEAVAAEEAAAD